MKETVMQPLDMSMMPVTPTAITWGDELLLMDTIGPSMPIDGQGWAGRYPMKLPLSCMLIVLEGEVKYRINFREIVAAGNTCAIIGEGNIIDNVAYSDNAQFIELMFSQQGIGIGQTSTHRLYTLLDEPIAMLKGLYGMLRTMLSNPAFNTRRETVANCIRFMLSIVEQDDGHNATVKNKPNRRDEIVASFLDCVNANYREHRELGFYADQLSLSLKYMSQVIYEQTGRHPSQWIKDYVILDAKTMLRSGRYTVQQVAEELHFPNQSFFGKYFKEAVGVSPKKWK